VNSSTEAEESLNPNEPISQEDVVQCKAEILRLHPLSRLELHEILPSCAWWIKCCCSCFVKSEQDRIAEERKAMIAESLEQNRTLNQILRAYNVTYHGSDFIRGQLPAHYTQDGHVAPDQQDQNMDPSMIVDSYGKKSDPYAAYGFGWVAYFNFMWVLFVLFTVLSIIMIGPMMMFYSQKGLAGVAIFYGPYVSMGNLGFSAAICTSDYVGVDAAKGVGCRTGTMT